MWGDLILTIRQAAVITGVSARQIQHWLNRGYLPASLKGNRRISGNALDMISLISQARLAGMPLRQAARLAQDYLAELEVPPLSQEDIDQNTLADLEEKLSAAIVAIEAVRTVMSQLRGVQAAPTAEHN